MNRPTTTPTSRRWKWLIYVGAIGALMAAAKFFHVQDLLKQALEWVAQLGPWGPAIFIALYVIASWIGMMPGTVMFVYLGSLAKAASGERARSTGEWALYGVGLFATVVMTVFVTRIAKDALARRITA